MSLGSSKKLWWLVLVGGGLVLAGIGCKSDGSSPKSDGAQSASAQPAEESEDDQGQPNAEASGESSGEASGDEGGEAPPPDLYPGMKFSMLEPDERKTFMATAKAELCPCPDATASLHACLKEEAKQCPLAKRAGTLVAAGVRNGLSQDDILDRLAEFTERAKRQYDFDLEGEPHKGPADAPVRIVEFADFMCPHCKRASGVMDKIVENYGDKVVIYYRNSPRSHPMSQAASRAAEAAHKQGKFWRMHDLIFENQKTLSQDKLMRFARQVGLNYGKFESDFKSGAIAQEVKSDKQAANRVGVRGTPAIFVNGTRYLGDLSVEGLSRRIDLALEEEEQEDGG